MKKTILYLLVLACFPLLSKAQELRIKEEGKTLFNKHAYLQLQGGAAYTLGEAEFKDLISPAAALQLGYKFSPVFGMRAGVTGWQAKGAWVAPAQTYKFNYVEGNVDVVFDMASLFGGFNPGRTVSPYLFLGGGGAYGFGNDEANKLNTGGYVLEYLWKDSKLFWAARGGLGFDFRLSDAVSLLLEGNVNMLPDRFNSKNANHPDWQFNALAGIKINLGKTYKRTEPVYYEPQPAPAPPPPAPAPKPEPKPAPAPVVKEFPALPPVHFAFDSDVVDTQKYATELATIVSVLKEFSDTDVEITGYTDHRGSNAYNDGLSLRRAEAVKKYLVEQGINAARLATSGAGKDPKTSGQEALTIQARRVEVSGK
ncbi:MAG TPA: OmpA family protein [Proteiniphilum sp.]|nr:OmpA family protein [Proteiniphilum sp.]HPJ49973.1 OmpA family protein [Proteiniphilum sp.]HPR20813.1 OmpA family protein [Proteiniphilum sp.]